MIPASKIPERIDPAAATLLARKIGRPADVLQREYAAADEEVRTYWSGIIERERVADAAAQAAAPPAAQKAPSVEVIRLIPALRMAGDLYAEIGTMTEAMLRMVSGLAAQTAAPDSAAAASISPPAPAVAPERGRFERWEDAGFGDIIPVVPGNVAPERWRGDSASLGKTPAKLRDDGTWAPLPRWQRIDPTPALLAAWSASGANVGLRTRNFPTFDADIDDPAIAEVVERVIVEHLKLFGGTAAVRRRANSSRFAIPARLEGAPLKKAVLKFKLPDGREQKVELLGDGQQFVVEGVHASGAAITWSPKPTTADDLPRLGTASTQIIFQEIEAALAARGCTIVSRPGTRADVGDATGTAGAPTPTGAALDREISKARSALASLNPAEFEYHRWITVGQALRHDLGEAGLAVWDEWSRRDESRARDGSPRYRGIDDLRQHWRTFKCRGGDHKQCVRLGTVYDLAKEAGWAMPADGLGAEEEFAAFDDHADVLGPEQPAGERLWTTNKDALLRPTPALSSPSADRPRYQIVRKGKDKGGVARTPEDIALYFAQDRRFTDSATLRLNVRRGVELNGVLLNDAGYTALGATVTKALGWDAVPSAEHLYAGVQLGAMQRQYDPIREYLDQLHWDGTPRLDDWLVRAGAEDTPTTRLVGRRWMIGAAGRGLHEPQPDTPPEFAPSIDRGTKMDYCLVLEGPQGGKKSAVFEALCPEPYFFDSSFSFDAGRVKDLYQALGENFIVEMAELDALGRSDVSAAKAVITSRTDKYRAPYARTPEAHPRRAALAGSANGREWQRDLTGGRRFWPAWCPTELDARWVRENREQLWAEAVHAYRAGEVYWEDDRLHALVAPEQEEHVNLPGWAHLVLPLLEANKARGVFTMEELVARERGLANLSTNQVADVLRYFGCTGPRRVKDSGDVVRVWEQGGLTLSEVRRRVHAGALRSAGFAGGLVFSEEPPNELPGAAR